MKETTKLLVLMALLSESDEYRDKAMKALEEEYIVIEKDDGIKMAVPKTGGVPEVVKAWNEMCETSGLNPVSRVTAGSNRYKSTTARIREFGLDKVLEAVKMVGESDFLTGKVKGSKGKPFMATYEWFVNQNNFPKVIEGKYNNSKPKPTEEHKGLGDDFPKPTLSDEEWLKI